MKGHDCEGCCHAREELHACFQQRRSLRVEDIERLAITVPLVVGDDNEPSGL
jgi:hypothetical protein